MSVFDDMVSFLGAAWKLKDEIVPCLIGAPGIGKTQAVYEHAKKVGATNVVTIIASQILPNEVSGITMPDQESRTMEIYDHFKLGHMQDGDILFFDELLEADQSVLSACLTLIESRMLMSGKKLPDIQIIAATNPTIQPTMLKANIRQRFMFKQFELDKKGTVDYIYETLGIKLGNNVGSAITDKDDKVYNILTPRSLTKLCKWMDAVEDHDELIDVANIINDMFSCNLGTEIKKAVMEKRERPMERAKEQVIKVAKDHGVNQFKGEDIDVAARDITFEELVQLLPTLPDWEAMKQDLEKINIDGEELEDQC